MTAYLSRVMGLAVGVAYGLVQVRSPAPPLIALIGLLGMVLGEQMATMAWRYVVPPAHSSAQVPALRRTETLALSLNVKTQLNMWRSKTVLTTTQEVSALLAPMIGKTLWVVQSTAQASSAEMEPHASEHLSLHDKPGGARRAVGLGPIHHARPNRQRRLDDFQCP